MLKLEPAQRLPVSPHNVFTSPNIIRIDFCCRGGLFFFFVRSACWVLVSIKSAVVQFYQVAFADAAHDYKSALILFEAINMTRELMGGGLVHLGSRT